MKTITRLLTFGIFAVLAVSAKAQTATPQDVLNKFLKLDFDGARLDSDGFKQVFPLTDWPDAPGYDSSIIVSSYKVGEPQFRGAEAKIMVTYEVVGMIAGNTTWEAFADNPKSETFKDEVNIPYVLVLKNGKWKVHEPNQAPHISIDVALKNEEALLADKTREADEHKAYQQIVTALRKLAAN
ncbi:MAG TPA: hypothetical protein VE961_06430 [Pyrinomonadaceae bacterium]|nr:hypothetical protein [Pyrinomonadaceae bacterium]